MNYKQLSKFSAVSCFFLASVFCRADTVESMPLPSLDPNLSILAEANRPRLFARLTAAFDQKYAVHLSTNPHKDFADGMAVYYLRQELQGLIDMWRATGKPNYLEQAEKLVHKAITDAQSKQRPLLWHEQPRGIWPCFFLKSVEKQTGGHNQICDFQGAAGFLMVASALKQAEQQGWRDIAGFVQDSIVEKWLSYDPQLPQERLKGPKSNIYLLSALDSARDKREHFAAICMDLDKLDYNKYPYKQWAKFLTELYIGQRSDMNQPPPDAGILGRLAPKDWGVIPNESAGGYVWHYITSPGQEIAILDTSHANRTIWLAAKAYQQGLINKERLDGFIDTLKFQVWAPSKGSFYFNNYVDGSDGQQNHLGPGRAGNIWFGWHRLAAYDKNLRELFISIAYDLTTGGKNIPDGAQNKTMPEAQMCLLAWAARLTSPAGQPELFP